MFIAGRPTAQPIAAGFILGRPELAARDMCPARPDPSPFRGGTGCPIFLTTAPVIVEVSVVVTVVFRAAVIAVVVVVVVNVLAAATVIVMVVVVGVVMLLLRLLLLMP